MNRPHQQLLKTLKSFLPEERLIHDPLRTLAYGTDASFYRLIPQLVVRVESEEEVSQVLQACRDWGTPVTFRAAGTSLSGQAVTDSVLILLGNGWNHHEILQDGQAIRLGPGVIGAQANAWLMPYGRKIGPDPASINSCMIGGIAANNASGMCCGTAQNSYQTVRHMRVIMADGTVLDTADPASRARFARTHAKLLARLADLGTQVRCNQPLADKIRHKYRLKNTTGYSLNALVDYAEPVDILKHLLIGSEGTLAFISEITYNTVPDHAHKAAALVYFEDIRAACEATRALKEQTAPVAAVELLDRNSLRSVADRPGMPAELQHLPDEACALLIDVRGQDDAEVAAGVEVVTAAVDGARLLAPVQFTQDPVTYELYWQIRKGIFPAIGAQRVIGTTCLIEDVAFPMEHLADGVLGVQALLQKYGYHDATVLGHALEGNLHFVFPQSFETDADVERYDGLMREVAELVAVRYGGSLKAEHGTGRNMAPFVEMEWGSDAYALMKTLKKLFDPLNLLNPDVILSDNTRLHVENLKPIPAAHELIDKCIECGFCEAVCPSRRLSLTPRQRIVLWREMSRLDSTGEDPARLQRLREDYQYQGLDTCAADGLCELRCPVDINTGDLVRAIRSEQNQGKKAVAQQISLHFAGVTRGMRVGLRMAGFGRALLGNGVVAAGAAVVNRISGGAVGRWSPSMGRAGTSGQRLLARTQTTVRSGRPAVVYLPACVTRVVGPAPGDPDTRSVHDVVLSILHKAGYDVIVPPTTDSLCCGMPFKSRGLFEVAHSKREEALDALRLASENGRLPILCDTSPCVQTLLEAQDSGLQIVEPATFIHQQLLPRLAITPAEETIALHVTCSTTRMGQGEALIGLARACAREVVLPASVTCCGFAGDKGFQVPELNASALQDLATEVDACQRGFSNSRTCEIGLSEHAGIPYQSILYLVDQVSASGAVNGSQPARSDSAEQAASEAMDTSTR
ncbi:FAD-binding oxidoreductase [Natronospirillum operosum]|uniref:D-lactate dehydrogenase (cytochrome) n=1 Tax=Natronospirillum operosum TaxID=2759953 RepID=A0A4Z0W7Z7_9GAMM|nr:FAD-binding and (Fe-S)-binding domain-containing protein [Natronospirillum operosum]TGG94184.1 FAD-binding oxidoreductase [Natronospirillum operosum]